MADELRIEIGADPSQLGSDLNRAQGMLQNFVRQAERIGEIGNKISDLGQKLTMYVTLPIAGLAAASVKAYGDIEALQKGLEAVMGSAARASGEFAKLREVAKLPGLGLKEAAQGSVALQSAGFSAGKARQALLSFGNALATVGKGANEMNFVILALTQLQNKTTGFGQDLRQLMEQLPQLRGALESAFGTSDSEAIAKTGATGAEVVNKLILEFAKLPKVTGGIKNAFENLKDSIFINLSRIGDAINKNFNISNIIEKVTNAIDKLVSAFEDLSPGMQKAILIITGIIAVIGPLIVLLGSIMTILPVLVAGFSALGTVLTVLFTVLGPELVLLAALGVAIYKYATAAETAAERQEKWTKSLDKAKSSAQAEISSLDQLYSKTQNVKLSIEERKKAVDDLQKQYPHYFQNINDEIILTGKATGSYNELRKAIFRASTARAAQAELDRREDGRLKEELAVREKINAALKVYSNPSYKNLKEFNRLVGNLNVSEHMVIGDKSILEQMYASPEEIKKAASLVVFKYVKELKSNSNKFAAENKPLLDIFKAGSNDISNLEKEGVVAGKSVGKGWKEGLEEKLKGLQAALDKAPTKAAAAKIAAQIAAVKKEIDSINPEKESEKQLAEIFPIGSINDLEKRAQLLQTAIDNGAKGLVKIRTTDKYGSETDKKGNPYLTGEVLSTEQAYKRLQDLNKKIKDLQYKSFQERSDELGKQWADFEQISQSFGNDIGKKQYGELIKGSKNYLEYLQKEKDILLQKSEVGILSDEDKDNIIFLENKINSLAGIKSPLEKFQQDIENALSRMPDLGDKLAYLNDISNKEFSKSGNSNAFLDRYRFINEQNQKFLQQQRDYYNEFLKDKVSYEDNKVLVEKKYADITDKINSDNALSIEQKARYIKEALKAKGKEIADGATEIVKNFNDEFKNLGQNSFASGLTNMFSSIGEAIANGGNVIGAVGNGLLKMFAGFLSDMGALLIKYGTLAIMKGTLDEIIKTGGYQAIAAGIAAIAVGAALSIAGSAIGSKANSNMSGSGGSVSTATGANYSGNTYSSNYTTGGSSGGEVVFRLAGSDLVGVLNREIAKGNRLNTN
ncbi:tape measure domain-containing protein [Chryseobacterium oranimense]|uniref:Tape measure domain-containing protein n=1 Tax=Chryseobacterium oranimense TaxID=421058 RepID=A0A1M5V0W3_9FLAO|nr:tape measure protein [Chryseobacterium oranimense]SHH68738.1 tape measure domain-containing protein [Chryseobacterium oranimense]